ncbi:MAG: aminoacyl-tRNA hydrolase [Patescibacteria group bacterium]
MKIIVGLGNIGPKYLKTKHNCGFLVLDEFTKQLEAESVAVDWKESRDLKAFTAKVSHNGQKFLLAKPTTFMNLSGESISQILNFYKEPLTNLVVIYDDIDLPMGNIRIRDKGSAGTHNGMRSIIQCLGSEDFKRIRLGIESRGTHAPEQMELHDFVLANFNKEEAPVIAKAIKEAVEELKKIISA